MPTPQEMRQALKMQQMRTHLKSMQQQEVSSAPTPSVRDEMPAWLDPGDRSVVKNLANNDEESLRYLQDKYPDAEIKKTGSDILLRRKGESSFSKLDPSFSPFSNPIGTLKDTFNDVKDLGYDALQATAEGVGAAAGIAAGGGAASLPLAAAGGAAGTTAASSLKQLLRQKYGLSDGFDGVEVAKDAAISAALPFGLKYGGQAIKQTAKAVPWAYSKAVGLTPEGMQVLAKRGEDIARIGKEGVTSTYENLALKIRDALKKQSGELGDQFNTLTGTQVSTKDARAAFKKAIEAEQSGVQNELSQELVKGLQAADQSIYAPAGKKTSSIYDMIGNSAPQESLDNISVKDALKLQQQLNTEYGDFGRQAVNMGQHRVGGGNSTNTAIERAAMESSDVLGKNIDTATDGVSSDLKGRYKRHIQQTKQVAPKFKDAATVEGTLNRFNKDKSEVLNELISGLDSTHGTGIQDTANLVEAHHFLNPSKQQGFKGTVDQVVGKSPIEKLLTAAGTGAGYVASGPVGGVFGAGLGRAVGKGVASPTTVKAFVKAQGLTQAGETKLMKALSDNPQLLNAIYGTTQAAFTE